MKKARAGITFTHMRLDLSSGSSSKTAVRNMELRRTKEKVAIASRFLNLLAIKGFRKRTTPAKASRTAMKKSPSVKSMYAYKKEAADPIRDKEARRLILKKEVL